MALELRTGGSQLGLSAEPICIHLGFLVPSGILVCVPGILTGFPTALAAWLSVL